MTLTGRSWADVRTELFGEPYMVWHDGPEFSGLRDAWRREPEELLQLLFAGMGEGDALAAQSLSELEPAPAGETLAHVIAMLEQHVPTAPAAAQVQIGLTLYKLTGDPTWTAPIVAVLDGAVHWSSRIDAAIALRQVPPTPQLRAALVRNVCDEEYLVRYHSATTLLRWAGSTAQLESDDALFDKITTDAAPEAWKAAADTLAHLAP